jgi:hypothetical protein
MPTYVADYRNPTVAFQLTAMGLSQRFISGAGHKVYAYIFVNTAQSSQIPMSGIVKQVNFNIAQITNNIYWFAQSMKGYSYGTVGGDITISMTDGHPTLDQYVDVNSPATGQPHDSPLANCLPASNGIPPSINSGGEERQSIYTVLSDKSEKIAYIVKGGILLYHTGGEVDIVFLIDPTKTTNMNIQSTCTVPTITFSSSEIDWIVRAPPPTNTIPGNYQEYPTVGGSMNEDGGTTALCLYQQITVA